MPEFDMETSIQLMEEVLRKSREGCDPLLAAFAEAYLLQARKAKDYNVISRDAYFPLGLASFATMLNVKSMRLVSLAAKHDTPVFESAYDTALDLINYSAFLAEWLNRQEKKNA